MSQKSQKSSSSSQEKSNLISKCQSIGIIGNRNMSVESLRRLIDHHEAGIIVPKARKRKGLNKDLDVHHVKEEEMVKLLKDKEEDLDFEEFHLQITSSNQSSKMDLEETSEMDQENNEAHELAEGKHPVLTSLLNSWAQLAEEQKVILFSASESNTL
jgi:hypothetical protein